jgi:hypothetical protein
LKEQRVELSLALRAMALMVERLGPYMALSAWLVNAGYVRICSHSIPELTSLESGRREPQHSLWAAVGAQFGLGPRDKTPG